MALDGALYPAVDRSNVAFPYWLDGSLIYQADWRDLRTGCLQRMAWRPTYIEPGNLTTPVIETKDNGDLHTLSIPQTTSLGSSFYWIVHDLTLTH